jgi:hypothetical protein
MRIQRWLLLCTLSAILLPRTAAASSLTLLTGVNAGGTVLAAGTLDPFWTISVQGGGFAAAKVLFPAQICCGMETAGTQAAWISDPTVTSGSANTGWGVGPTAIARRTFDLTGFDLGTTGLAGSWRVADFRGGIYLNGTLIAAATAVSAGLICPCDWQIDQAFSVVNGSPLFLPGLNVLELRGSSTNSQFDGFWLAATVRDAGTSTAVPEPATLTFLGLGLAGLRATFRRRR